MKTLSTKEAAKEVGIGRATIMRWLSEGRVSASQNIPIGGGLFLHRWTRADIARLEEFKKKNYRKKGATK